MGMKLTTKEVKQMLRDRDDWVIENLGRCLEKIVHKPTGIWSYTDCGGYHLWSADGVTRIWDRPDTFWNHCFGTRAGFYRLEAYLRRKQKLSSPE